MELSHRSVNTSRRPLLTVAVVSQRQMQFYGLSTYRRRVPQWVPRCRSSAWSPSVLLVGLGCSYYDSSSKADERRVSDPRSVKLLYISTTVAAVYS